jgi:hypothetical protein
MNGFERRRLAYWASPEWGAWWTYMKRPGRLVRYSSLAALLMLAMILSACGVSPLSPGDSIPLMSGMVRDAITNAPLANATVEAQGHSTVSAADGTYSFPRLSYSPALVVTARKDGYRDYSETLQATRETSAYGIFRDIRLIPR